jgi:2-aminoadipate transaminase
VNDARSATQTGAGAPWAAAAVETLLNARARAMAPGAWSGTEQPDSISLTAGIPDPATLPAGELLEAARAVLTSPNAKWALEYGGSYGYERLRALVADRIDPQPGLGFTAANVALTSGGAQALHNVFDTFVDPGDTVIVETPVWGGALRTLRAFQARMEAVPLDEHGIRIDELEAALTRLTAEGRRPKLIYTIPTFQNPMGTTAALERRKQVIDLAARHRVLIVEDDPYGDLRFAGQAMPSLLTLSGGDGVLRCGTFSKTIATGLRVGWIQGAKELVDATTRMRFDNGTSPFASYIITAYIEAGHHEPHVAAMCEVYRAKCDAMLSALEETCTRFATWTRPEGGFFVWLTLSIHTDARTVVAAAQAEGVQCIPGTSFFPNGGGEHNIRLAYSYVTEDEIAEAVRRLARAIERARG